MERLTRKELMKACNDPWDYCGLDSVCKRDCFKPEPCKIPKMVHRLAEHEDILFDANGNERISIDRLRELAEADKDRRCLVLPFKAGQRVYDISEFLNGTKSPETYELKDDWLSVGNAQNGELQLLYDSQDITHEIGKTVFLTRADAEKALGEKNEK